MALSYPVLMAVLNELYFILNMEYLEIGTAVTKTSYDAEKMCGEVDKDKTNCSSKGKFFNKREKRELAQCAKRGNDLLESVETHHDLLHSVETDDVKLDQEEGTYFDIGGGYHVWTPFVDHPAVRIFYSENDDTFLSKIGAIKIPARRDGNRVYNELFCPKMWVYLLKTIAFLPAWNNMAVGGSGFATNTAAELVNRYLKYIEGFKRMPLNNYIDVRSTSWYLLTRSWLIRNRAMIVKQYKGFKKVSDMWCGTGHRPKSKDPFDDMLNRLWKKFKECEVRMWRKNAQKGIDAMFDETVKILKEQGVWGQCGLKISNRMVRFINEGAQLQKRKPERNCLAYFGLWLVEWLKTKYDVTFVVNFADFEETKGKSVEDMGGSGIAEMLGDDSD